MFSGLCTILGIDLLTLEKAGMTQRISVCKIAGRVLSDIEKIDKSCGKILEKTKTSSSN